MLSERDFAEFTRGSLQMIVLYLLRGATSTAIRPPRPSSGAERGNFRRRRPRSMRRYTGCWMRTL